MKDVALTISHFCPGPTQGDTLSEWSAKNPYDSTVTVNFVLNGEGSKKETRHIVFDLGDSGLEYKAGDALGVIPITSSELVEDVLVALVQIQKRSLKPMLDR